MPRNQRGRRSQVLSVTMQPSSDGLIEYDQRDTGMPSEVTLKENSRPGAASVTVDTVVQRWTPRRLQPRKRLPTVAVQLPSSTFARTVSSDRPQSESRSLISAYTRSGDALTLILPVA